MSLDHQTQELFETTLELVIANFATGEHGSLQGVFEEGSGNRIMLKIFARDDEDMFRQARAELATAVRFCVMGVVPFSGAAGEAALVLYWQQPGVPLVQRAYLPLQIEGQELRVHPSIDDGPLPETWI